MAHYRVTRPRHNMFRFAESSIFRHIDSLRLTFKVHPGQGGRRGAPEVAMGGRGRVSRGPPGMCSAVTNLH